MKTKLEAAQWGNVWAAKAVPDDWLSMVRRNMRDHFRTESTLRVAGMSSLAVFQRMGAARDRAWLDRSRVHPGGLLRLKLRCGAAPLMERVGASLKTPRQERCCLMCGTAAVEDAEHFVSRCSYFSQQRDTCVARIESKLGSEHAQYLRRALRDRAPAVFLSDRLWKELPAEVAQAVDTAVCDFLKVAWRRRKRIWSAVCVPGSEWRLQ